jgi:glycosyltransferase involved in cell wall biosynthesis
MVGGGRWLMSPIVVSLDVSAIPDRPAGAGRYVVELARALGTSEGAALTLTCRRGDAERWASLAPSSRVVDSVWRARPLRVAYEQWRLGTAVRRLRDPAIAVHHGPHYTFPHGLGSVGSVVTVHDMTFFDHPEWHVASKVPFFQRAIRRAAREADVIVCVSQSTADRFQSLLSPRGLVLVAPHGVDHSRFRPGPADDAPDAANRQRFGVAPGRGYILHLGTIEPRKGIVPLVEAFDRIAEGHEHLDLVLAGIDGWGSAEVERAVAACRHGGRVRRLGYVDDEAVPALLRGARVVAYPSFEEGFGLPALEALACGAPLVTTTGTSMAEFAGSAAWTAPAGDAAALAAALEDVLAAGQGELERRRADGIERAAAFTWERTASVHLEAYAAASR